MMIILSSLMAQFLIVWTVKTMNPVKVSIGVLLSSCLIFLSMSLMSGLTWFAIILFMLFMGGIIMMFMILSSIMPNEKSMKTKNITLIMISAFMMNMVSPLSSSAEMVSTGSKSFLMSGMNFFLMVSVILFYFLGTMSTLSSEKTPMRSMYC